jgi:hypothetical protein
MRRPEADHVRSVVVTTGEETAADGDSCDVKPIAGRAVQVRATAVEVARVSARA